MLEQGDDAVADEARGRVVAGDDQLEDRRQQLLGAEPLVAVAGADQPAHEVVAGAGLLGLDERFEHRDDRVGRLLRPCVLGGGRGGDEQRGESAPQVGPIRLGHAEQLADDGERQRERERADEVDPRVRSGGGDVVEEVVDDGLHARAERLDAARREGGRDEAAQPGVIRRVDAEHVPREGGTWKALGHDAAAGRQRGVHVLGEPRVVERDPRLLVADHEPGVVPVGQRDRVHRAQLADRGEQREGVVAVVGSPRPSASVVVTGRPPRARDSLRLGRGRSATSRGAEHVHRST